MQKQSHLIQSESRFLDGIWLRSSGVGAPVVLVHGVGMDLEMWEPVAGRLRNRRVIRYDLQGHGSSPKPPAPYSLTDFRDQLLRVADGLGLDRFDLVGFSMGAMIAQAFAFAYPARLNRLFLLNGVHDRNPAESEAIRARARDVLNGGYRASIEAALDRWFTPEFREQRPDVIAAVRKRMEENDLPAYAAAYAVFANGDRELVDAVGGIDVPVLVATGEFDQRSTPGMAKALAARLRNARPLIIEGQRHMIPLEQPEALAALIDGFLCTDL
jgi:pimeloyl-ACP methyl ester carboxylesterase